MPTILIELIPPAPPQAQQKTRTRRIRCSVGWGWRIIRPCGPHPCGAGVPPFAVAARRRRTSMELLTSIPPAPPQAQQKTRTRRVRCSVGWGWRIRTSTYGVRVRCPAVRRIPSCRPDAKRRASLNAWRTGDAYGLYAGRPSYARRLVRLGSDSLLCAGWRAAHCRRHPAHGRYRDGWHPPVRLCHHR